VADLSLENVPVEEIVRGLFAAPAETPELVEVGR
jgi:hypothetical protein